MGDNKTFYKTKNQNYLIYKEKHKEDRYEPFYPKHNNYGYAHEAPFLT